MSCRAHPAWRADGGLDRWAFAAGSDVFARVWPDAGEYVCSVGKTESRHATIRAAWDAAERAVARRPLQ